MIDRLNSFGVSGRWLEQNRQVWLRIAIVVTVLLASGYLALNPSPLYLLVVPGIGVVLALMQWPPLGLLAVIGASLVVPFSVGTGTASSINASMLMVAGLIGLWIFDMVVRRREIQLVKSRTLLPLVAFVVVSVLAFGVGQLRWFGLAGGAPLSAQVGGLGIFILSAGVFVWVGNQIRDLIWLKLATWFFLGLSGLYMVARILPSLRPVANSLFQPGAVSGSLFWTWIVALSFSQAVFNRRLKVRWRVLAGAVLLSTLYVSLFRTRGWSSGWIPSVVALVTILWLGAPRIGLMATLAGVGLVVARAQSLISQLILVGDNEYSLVTRLEAWRIVLEIVRVNPLLGLGPANYRWYTSLFSILGYYVQFNSHNNYIDILAQTGVLGLACFLWFAWTVGRLGWQLRSRVPGGGFAEAYVYGALGGLAGTLIAGMLGDWVLPFVYNVGFSGFRASVLGWIFLGGLLALERIVHHSE